ncbi:phosphate/phosphite/phosphonate ABC transporter substrate-binding protein [Nonomuraea sp. PA05]|uniref:phosphate/phosphite/phosphonate ABC transporter substrate-binding protein n=1 Tax=Nonomuraea sp. PA05 TaxID=2604466 RepID=UPI0011D3298D|nr:phosphate/phosphite/phosphonate ABC transporter substrate-binding protein [Nonomuraea sp. PA05]TYB60617.1 phosphate/phosphite/phosphonate ABC transporter substrate-binding protein [Nonomuraea sp. PA05]
MGLLRKVAAVIALGVLLAACGSGTGGSEPAKLTIGLPPGEDSPEQLQLSETLKKLFADATGLQVEVQRTADYMGVVEAMRGGHVDAALFSPFATVIGMETAPIELLLASKGGTDPASVIVTPKDSGITELAQLKGKTITLVDPASATGNLMPRQKLKEAGLEVERDYQVTYAGSHDAVGAAVNSGKIDAGAMNYVGYRTMVEKGVIDGSEVRVLAETGPVVMGATIVVRKELDPAVKQAIQDKLPAAWPTDPTMLRTLGAAPAKPDEAAVTAAKKVVTDLGIKLENIR